MPSENLDTDNLREQLGGDSDPELSWALRGANAGNFGIVTALEFELLPITEVYGGAVMFPPERAAKRRHDPEGLFHASHAIGA